MNKTKALFVLLLSAMFSIAASYPATALENKTTTKKSTESTEKKVTNSVTNKVNNIHAKAKNLDKKVLELGVKAHQTAKSKKITKKNLISIIDFSKPSTEKRFWVIDLDSEKVLFHDFVAHGKNSGAKLAKKFSNVPGSLTSSIGVFLTSNPYQGKHGYSMRLDGLEKGVNDNARARAIVMHGANYVSSSVAKQLGRLGRSWGCPALPHKTNKKVIDTIKEGSLLFAYYPDKRWLNNSTFLG